MFHVSVYFNYLTNFQVLGLSKMTQILQLLTNSVGNYAVDHLIVKSVNTHKYKMLITTMHYKNNHQGECCSYLTIG